MKIYKLLSISLSGLFYLLPAEPVIAGNSAIEMEVKVPSGNSISVSHLKNAADVSLLWLPSEHGLTKADKKIAARLSDQGVDIWLADLLNSYFLIPAASSINKIPVADISLLLDKFLAGEKKQSIVLASGRTAVVLLQALKTSKRPAGIILISPNFYTSTPEPGTSATYLPVTSQTKQNIRIFQPQLSPWYWQREEQTRVLESGGSKVKVKVLPGVRDRFYFRPDALASEKNLQENFPTLLFKTINQISQ